MNSHIWFYHNPGEQDCCQYHQAKDGDGWVEYKGSLAFERAQKVIPLYQIMFTASIYLVCVPSFDKSCFSTLKMEIPRAFVCAESRIFDVSEWAICQVSCLFHNIVV